MSGLVDRKCKDCKPGSPALTDAEQQELSREIPEWKNIEGKKIQREFKFPSYAAAIDWVQKIAKIADAENHHPDLHIFYRKVVVEFWTHTVKGLSENDYILAAKFDAAFDI